MENFIGIEQDEDDIIKNILESKEFDFRDGYTPHGKAQRRISGKWPLIKNKI